VNPTSTRRVSRLVFIDRFLRVDVNPTAILHITAAILVGAGLLLSGRVLPIALAGLRVASCSAGIVISRRDDADTSSGS
jgi:hypothetical protein